MGMQGKHEMIREAVTAGEQMSISEATAGLDCPVRIWVKELRILTATLRSTGHISETTAGLEQEPRR